MSRSPQTYIVTVDVGNTSTTLGLYRHGRVTHLDRVPTAERRRAPLLAQLRAWAGPRPVGGVMLASVVPAVDRLWRQLARTLWPQARFRQLHHRLQLGVAVNYPRPETIGADRLANAAGAVARYGAPVIVADFGTAVTFDVITREQGYVGGIITPGLPLMFSYLAEKTALLPRLAPGGAVRHAVGRTTREAMQLGARWGYRGMVREIVAMLRRHLAPARPRLCATGGHAGWVLRGAGLPMTIDRDLTLYGLGRIYELNS